MKETNRIDALDGLRAIAAFLVLSFHYWQQSWLTPVLRLGPLTVDLSIFVVEGAFGVGLLFALSGFGLYWSARCSRFSVGRYYRKRAARILPAYLLCVAICAAYQIGRLEPDTLREQLIAYLTLTQMTTTAVANNRINGVLWSVAIEAQFYLIFPLLLLAMKKQPYLTAAVALCVGQLWRTWRGVYHYDDALWFWTSQLPGWIDVFTGGMLAAHIAFTLRETLSGEQRRSLAPAMTALALTGLLVMFLAMRYCYVNRYDDIPENNTRNELTMRLFFAAGACLALVGCSQCSRWLRRALGNPIARFLGGISYQVYLWHIWLALRLKELHIPEYATERAMDDVAWRLPYVLVSLCATVTIATAITYCIEKPAYALLTAAPKGENK